MALETQSTRIRARTIKGAKILAALEVGGTTMTDVLDQLVLEALTEQGVKIPEYQMKNQKGDVDGKKQN